MKNMRCGDNCCKKLRIIMKSAVYAFCFSIYYGLNAFHLISIY